MRHTRQHLKKWRVENELTQQEVATVLGVTKATVGTWETGRVKLNDERAAAYAEAIDFPSGNENPAPATVKRKEKEASVVTISIEFQSSGITGCTTVDSVTAAQLFLDDMIRWS